MEKYLIVKVGGEDCQYRTEWIFGKHFCDLTCTGCSNPKDCGNTKEELVAKISKEKELCRIDVNTVVSAVLEAQNDK